MTWPKALELAAAIREEFPEQFVVALEKRSHDATAVRVRKRGGGPRNPRASLFRGPPVWINQPHEWPEVARSRFGLKVVGV